MNSISITALDRLPLHRMSASNRDDCRLQGMDLSVPARLRVIEGPQNDYFSKQRWYQPQYDDVTSLLSDTEKQNAAFIKQYETP